MNTVQRPWDARLARVMVAPLKNSWVTPNHLTTVRLGVGLAGSAAFMAGTYGLVNIGALLLVVSNFLDHADGELARMTGKTSRIGHQYDLASDAAVTIAIFVAIGVGISTRSAVALPISPIILGAIAGIAIATIFFQRMRIEEIVGKADDLQGALGGFETEDVLYLMPLATLCNGVLPLLIAAAIGAPLFALRVHVDYRRVRGAA